MSEAIPVKFWRDWLSGFERLPEASDPEVEDLEPTGYTSRAAWNRYFEAEREFVDATEAVLNGMRVHKSTGEGDG